MATIHPASNPVAFVADILSASRFAVSPRALRMALMRRGWLVRPRLPVWISVCRAAGLLDDQMPPRPTPYVADWLDLSPDGRLASLRAGWQAAPQSSALRKIRACLAPWAAGQPANGALPPGVVRQRETSALRSLGLCGSPTSPPGQAMITPQSFILNRNRLAAPQAAHLKLLWDLEAYLQPVAPATYALTPPVVAAIASGRRGPASRFAELLETCLGQALPAGLARALAKPPQVRCICPHVLEFAEPELLANLRRRRSWRRRLSGVFSPRHVAFERRQMRGVLRALERNGVAVDDANAGGHAHAQAPQLVRRRTSQDAPALSSGDRAYLLGLVLAASPESLPAAEPAPPRGLAARLEAGLPEALRTGARRQAVSQRAPATPPAGQANATDDAPPPAAAPELLDVLARAINAQQPLDILYHAANRPAAEQRHVTPLLLEQRGARQYLVAYCHTRRANRTFRLDRLALPAGGY